MNPLTWQNPGQLFVAQDVIKINIYSVAELRVIKLMTDKQKTWYWMKCIPWVMKYSFRWMLLEHSVSEKREYSHTNTFCDISVGVLLCLLC